MIPQPPTDSHREDPSSFHCARHTYATLALRSGKSVRWVADQFGYPNPELTLRVCAHALREEESNLSFLDFGGTTRHPAAPVLEEGPRGRTPHP